MSTLDIFGRRKPLPLEVQLQMEAESSITACHDPKYYEFWNIAADHSERPEGDAAWDAYWRGDFGDASRLAKDRRANWNRRLSECKQYPISSLPHR